MCRYTPRKHNKTQKSLFGVNSPGLLAKYLLKHWTGFTDSSSDRWLYIYNRYCNEPKAIWLWLLFLTGLKKHKNNV